MVLKSTRGIIKKFPLIQILAGCMITSNIAYFNHMRRKNYLFSGNKRNNS